MTTLYGLLLRDISISLGADQTLEGKPNIAGFILCMPLFFMEYTHLIWISFLVKVGSTSHRQSRQIDKGLGLAGKNSLFSVKQLIDKILVYVLKKQDLKFASSVGFLKLRAQRLNSGGSSRRTCFPTLNANHILPVQISREEGGSSPCSNVLAKPTLVSWAPLIDDPNTSDDGIEQVPINGFSDQEAMVETVALILSGWKLPGEFSLTKEFRLKLGKLLLAGNRNSTFTA
ncbi:hypothetical protein DAPPUDRAFT_119296 [Daphnia pulex]|uniref:Uncharacterized protein n=1 Tax=Daphnia pulex TaxID=6669 RepID=E9HY43_DAPPU|nr:hypothetical protein DAPPUDRAFT_119296 [Daphnia pulex]|eukprot:EFX63338.1 hypothetical protein DAPPUDRAFT_119296 [Daphnia pulex]